jgi:L-malate glycosyltransferase
MSADTATGTDAGSREMEAIRASHSKGGRGSSLAQLMVRAQVRGLTALIITLLRIAKRFGPRPIAIPDTGATILLTGTFHSENWVRSHIAPLAMSRRCARVLMVATSEVPSVEKVEAIYPPAWLRRSVGRVPARLLVFAWVAIRTRPHIIGAFHLLFNGLFASLLARCIGARAMYFCVGGPAEMLAGGLWSENRFFERLPAPDLTVERWLIEAVGANHLVITMGNRAVDFFRQRGVTSPIHVVPGGISPERFRRLPGEWSYDAILVGRLARIKRIDLFIRAIGHVARTRPGVKAVIVGDGALGEELQALARELGLSANITFAGHQSDVGHWLRQSRVFLLTSDSEGLALSLMEAMICGLPAVVSDVGDLGDLVVDGVNGYLVASREAEAFGQRLNALLNDASTYTAFSDAARASSRRYETSETARLWDDLLQMDSPAATGQA